MPSQSEIMAAERREHLRQLREIEAKARAARQAALSDPKRLEAITAYQIEKQRAQRQGKPVLRPLDDYRRTVPEFVYEFGGAR